MSASSHFVISLYKLTTSLIQSVDVKGGEFMACSWQNREVLEGEAMNSSPFASIDSNLCVDSRLVQTYDKMAPNEQRCIYKQSFNSLFVAS